MSSPIKPEDVIYRPHEAADILGISRWSILNMHKRGEIQAYKINNRGDLRIPRKSLLEFMNRRGIPDDLA